MYKVVKVARLRRVAFGILLLGALILTPLISSGAGSVSLIWNASTNIQVAGYNVYYGSASHSYPNQVFVGTNLNTVVGGLGNGNYFFAVTAVDAIGNESDFSNEINYQIAGVNQPPTISGIANQSTYDGQATAAIAFTVNDPDTGASGLLLSAVSSNAGLVPNGNIVLGGSGANRTVTITPVAGQTGAAQITITVSDGSLTAQSSFALTVQSTISTNHAPTITAIASQSAYAGVASAPIAFAINDPDTGVNGLTLSAASSNTGLVPNGNIVFAGSGQNRTVTITPLAGQTGTAQITITVSDGSLTAQSSFALTVQQSTALPSASAARNSYNGLFYESAGLQVQSAGAVKISVTTGGKYSGSLQMAAGRYSFSGQFGALCQSAVTIARKGSTPLTLNFTLKPGSSGQLTGTLSDGTWNSQLYGDLASFNSKTNPAPYAGSYTLAIPGQNVPFSVGNGFGSLSVDGSGNVKLAGSLADGTKLSQSAPVSSDGTWPVFAPLYAGKGFIIGWVSFVKRPNDDLHGTLSWLKLPTPSTFYPSGLTIASDAVGSAFTPGPQPYVFGRVQLQMGLNGDGLIMALKISPTIGTFTGSILNRVTGKPVKFQGALVDKLNAGYGFVLGTNQSTPVTLMQ